MTETPMEHADKFCWTGPGQVQVIDFDPASVTPLMPASWSRPSTKRHGAGRKADRLGLHPRQAF